MLLEIVGLNVKTDKVGNVIALRKGIGTGSAVILATHLDTVFAKDVDVTPKRDGDQLTAPGIGDNSRGLVSLLLVARVRERHGVATKRGIDAIPTDSAFEIDPRSSDSTRVAAPDSILRSAIDGTLTSENAGKEPGKVLTVEIKDRGKRAAGTNPSMLRWSPMQKRRFRLWASSRAGMPLPLTQTCPCRLAFRA